MKKVKRKVSRKKLTLLLIPLIILIIILLNLHTIIVYYQSKVTGYPTETIEIINEYKIYKKIKDVPYSKTLDKLLLSEYYNPKYLNSYLKIEYHEKASFLLDINLLLDKNYTADEINLIYNSLTDESIKILTINDYLKDITNILKLSYFKETNLERYIKYNKEDYETKVTYVNIGLDQKYYEYVTDIGIPKDETVIVNKYHKLPSDYVPSDLEEINNKYNRGFNNKLRHNARIKFEEMAEAARKENIYIYSGSAYRSYSYQQNLYNRYVNQNGFAEAETFSARAGYSEHQTGLATDILNAKIDYLSKNDQEYTWLVNNSYKYGYILRYPEGKDKITGYMYEEWHFRYIGIPLAQKVYESGLTYDEYVARN